ncbi:hypothetical protein D3C78_1879540 [compost metagenome]
MAFAEQAASLGLRARDSGHRLSLLSFFLGLLRLGWLRFACLLQLAGELLFARLERFDQTAEVG